MKGEAYPLLLKSVYQPYIWGGDRIIRHFGRSEPPGVYAESWEVSDRPEGMSVVLNGRWEGRTLAELIREQGPALLGSRGRGDGFPLLIKLIDARETLSVQVHPDDETARRHGGEPKTEMWYVLDATPDACVYAGWRPGVNEAALREGLRHNSVEQLLNKVPVQPGDAVFMPGGCAHAIGAGCLLLEVQQNSNTTYRIYDWGRTGTNGKPRELHIEQAIRVMRWAEDGESLKATPKCVKHEEGNECWELLRCPYFLMERLVLSRPGREQHDGASFHVLFSPDAALRLRFGEQAYEMTIPRGASCLIPASLTHYTVSSDADVATVLRISKPCEGPA